MNFAVASPRFWNTSPAQVAELRQPDTKLVTFRRLLKAHLFKCDTPQRLRFGGFRPTLRDLKIYLLPSLLTSDQMYILFYVANLLLL